MKSFEIETRIEDGKFKVNRTLIVEAIKLFNGKNVKVTISKIYKKRTEKQNDFYWYIWIPIFQELIMAEWGEYKTKNEVHEILKTNCNYIEKVNEQTGEVLKISRSTTELSSAEWEFEFKNRVRQFALDFFNTTLPEPNEQLKLKY